MEIQGLTPRQQELATVIWAIESPEQVLDFFNTIPQDLLQDAYLVYRMIIEVTWDDIDLGDCAEAKEVIEHIRGLSC